MWTKIVLLIQIQLNEPFDQELSRVTVRSYFEVKESGIEGVETISSIHMIGGELIMS